MIASQRELSLGKVRPDALLQAFLLFALAALLRHLATGRLRYAALMGAALGCAYLTKSFAFVVAFLSIAVLAAFRWLWLKHKVARVIPAALVAFVCFAVVAGPYVAALSHQAWPVRLRRLRLAELRMVSWAARRRCTCSRT